MKDDKNSDLIHLIFEHLEDLSQFFMLFVLLVIVLLSFTYCSFFRNNESNSNVSEIISVIEPTELEVTTTIATDTVAIDKPTDTVATDKPTELEVTIHDLKVFFLIAVAFAFLLFLLYLVDTFI